MKALHSTPKKQCQAQQLEGNLFIDVNETTMRDKNFQSINIFIFSL